MPRFHVTIPCNVYCTDLGTERLDLGECLKKIQHSKQQAQSHYFPYVLTYRDNRTRTSSLNCIM